MMPFVTEELWQRVAKPHARKVSIAFGPYPTPDIEQDARDSDVETQMETLQEVITAARTVRSEFNVEKRAETRMLVRSASAETVASLRKHTEAIRSLVKTKGDSEFEASGERPRGFSSWPIVTPHGPIDVLVELKGLVTAEDVRRGKELLERRLHQVEKDVLVQEKQLATPAFVERATREKVEQTKADVDAKRVNAAQIRERLGQYAQLADEL
jgi:valyl-tRNA synthetase